MESGAEQGNGGRWLSVRGEVSSGLAELDGSVPSSNGISRQRNVDALPNYKLIIAPDLLKSCSSRN